MLLMAKYCLVSTLSLVELFFVLIRLTQVKEFDPEIGILGSKTERKFNGHGADCVERRCSEDLLD